MFKRKQRPPQDRKYLFESCPIPKAIMTLSVPTVVSSLVMVLYSMADTYFVGLINDPVETAAVTLAGTVLLAFNAVNNLFGVGASSMMSRALGRDDIPTLRQASSFGFWGAVGGGILFSILCTVGMQPLLALLGADAATAASTEAYLFWTVTLGAVPAILNVVMAYLVRSEGAALHASLGTISGCLLNVVLDPIFVLVFGMKAEGAAIATFISNCAAVLYFVVYLLVRRGKTMVCVDPRVLRGMRASVAGGVCSVGVPASIQNLLNVAGYTIFNNLAAGFGPAALAAMGICNKIHSVPLQVVLGMSQGIMPLVSYNYAAKKPQRMKQAVGFTTRISMVALVAVMALLLLFPRAVVSFFIGDAQTVEYGALFLRGFSLGIPFLAMDFIGVGVYQATGMGKTALFFALARKLLLEIPLMYLLNLLVPLYGLPYAQPITELILAVAAIVILQRIFRRAEQEAATPAVHDTDSAAL